MLRSRYTGTFWPITLKRPAQRWSATGYTGYTRKIDLSTLDRVWQFEGEQKMEEKREQRVEKQYAILNGAER